VVNGLLVHFSSTDEQDTQTIHQKFMLHSQQHHAATLGGLPSQ
jgi:hypothetical protein